MLGQQFGVLINVTPSMKLGAYRKSFGKINRGDVVSLCLPNKYKKFGLSQSYILKGKKCLGADPLIKEVVAIPGDVVILNDNDIVVNGVQHDYVTLHYDKNGNALDVYPRGKYKIKGYWLIGTHAKNSWDSRYWGPIAQSKILNKLKPLLTW